MNKKQVKNRGGRLACWSAIALGATLPVSVALDGLLTYLLLPLGWLTEGQIRPKLRYIAGHPVARAALLLFGLLLLSCIWSLGTAHDILDGLSKEKALLWMALMLPLFRSQAVKTYAWRTWLAAMGVVLFLSLLIWLRVLPTPMHFLSGDPYSPTVFKLRITQNLFMAFAVFYLALQARHSRGKQRLWCTVGALLGALDVLLVPGRTGWLALAVLLFYFMVQQYRWKGIALSAVTLAVLVTVGWFGSSGFHNRLKETEHSYATWQPGVAAETSDGERLEFWRQTLQIIKAHPLLGVGAGGFVPAYTRTVAGTPIPVTHNPHNQYLLMLAQLGPAGLLALLWLFWTIWRQAAGLPEMDRSLARGLVLAMASGCLFNSFLIDHAESFFFAWAVAALFGGNAATGKPQSVKEKAES